MAATIAWTTTNVPGSMTPTGNQADTTVLHASSGKCARCERWPWEGACPGVLGEVTHLGS
jgi:hypothetical protein